MAGRQSVLIMLLTGVALACALSVTAQSSNQNLPTPIRSNEISGTIAALDLGDSRLTRHFYAFEARPGDLQITVNTRNLNGDVDIFTAITFRPLTKISIYANTIPPEVTKSLYFRTRQILILRVEARTPNDDAGAYRITFGGSFLAFSGGIPVAEEAESTETAQAGGRKTKRVSSVGATIEEPATEMKPEGVKTAEVVAEKPPEETAAETKPAPKPRTTRTTPTRTARGRGARTPPPKPKPTEPAKTEAATTPAEATKPATIEGEVKSGEQTATEKSATQEAQPAGARLIIEEKDGTRIDRPMSTVRRVIIEGNMIVIVLKSGRIERIPMAIVARMSIEP